MAAIWAIAILTRSRLLRMGRRAATNDHARKASHENRQVRRLHADGGWDTYSFLKITTDEGIVGWSEFNESRRSGMTQ